jgi:KilA-N domain
MNFTFLSTTLRADGLVNATALTTAYREATGITKNARDWLKTATANESIKHLAARINILATELVVTENGVGTWIHPKLAPILAMWISPEFQFAVVELIERKLQPKVEQPIRQLPPVRDAIDYLNAINSHPVLAKDPILVALVGQRLAEQLSPGVKSIDHPEQPLNITSIASNLGYSQKEIGNGAALGKFIKLRHQSLGTSQHGKYQVNVYLPSEVENSVQEFFARSAKKLAATK